MQFTDQQKRAIEHWFQCDPQTSEQPEIQCIEAGPGSGKTTVLAARIDHLIEDQGADPGRICAITFTRAGGRALQEKIRHRIRWAGTLHALAMNVLEIATESLLDEDEANEIAKNILADNRLEKRFTSAAAALRTFVSPREPTGDAKVFQRAFQRAIGTRKTHDLVLSEFLRYLKERGTPGDLHYLLVDEYQDTSEMDNAIYRALAPAIGTCVVGDPNQAIYGFRGAEKRFFTRAARRAGRTAGVTPLSYTFRFGRKICAVANDLIGAEAEPADTGLRIEPADLATSGYVGAQCYETPRDEETGIIEYHRVVAGDPRETGAARSHGSFAVLVRYNSRVTEIREAMENAGFRLAPRLRGNGESRADKSVRTILRLSVERPSVREAEATRALSTGDVMPEIVASLHRRYATMTDLFDAVDEEARDLDSLLRVWCAPQEIRNHAAVQDAWGPVEALQNHREMATVRDDTGLHVDTIHAAKGREFDHVWVASDNAPIGPDERQETNLRYVAATRARATLIVSRALMELDPWTRKRVEHRGEGGPLYEAVRRHAENDPEARHHHAE